MNITLPPEIESRLLSEASRRGLAAEEFLRKLLADQLPPSNGGWSLVELFAQWEADEGTTDPIEIARRNAEVEQFKKAMNESRVEMEGPGSRKLFA